MDGGEEGRGMVRVGCGGGSRRRRRAGLAWLVQHDVGRKALPAWTKAYDSMNSSA